MNPVNQVRTRPTRPLELLTRILATPKLEPQESGWIVTTRGDLTYVLANQPRRPGSVTTAILDEMIPALIRMGLASEVKRPGKPPSLVFRPLSKIEFYYLREQLRAEMAKLNDQNNPSRERRLSIQREWQTLLRTGPHGKSPEVPDLVLESDKDVSAAVKTPVSDRMARIAELNQQIEAIKSKATVPLPDAILGQILRLIGERRQLEGITAPSGGEKEARK